MKKVRHSGKKIRQIAAALAMVMLICSIQMPSVFGAFDVSITDADKSEQWEKNRAQTYASVKEMHPEYFYKGMLWIGTWLIDSTGRSPQDNPYSEQGPAPCSPFSDNTFFSCGIWNRS